ncbi:MAG: translation elongation factor Ts [Bacteroidota bacterium]
MANITAAEVNKLRQITGSGMMDCKNALVEADGDVEKAIDILRKKGQKVANKRSDREAGEGLVIANTDASAKVATITMLNCETDFVAKNQEFVDLANAIANIALTQKPATMDDLKAISLNGRTIAESISDMIGKTGEKMELSEYHIIQAPRVFAYNHMGNKLAAIMGLNSDSVADIDTVGKEVVMQIAAMAPVALDKEGVDAKIVEREIEVGKEQAREEGKPEEMLEKIAIGKLNKFYKDNTLLNQDFVRDNKKTVRQYLEESGKGLTVTEFKRVSLK